MLDYFLFPPATGRREALCSQPVRMVMYVRLCVRGSVFYIYVS